MKLLGGRFFAQLGLVAPAVVLLTASAVWLASQVTEFRRLAGAYAASCARNRELAAQAAASYRGVLGREEVLAVLAQGRLSLREAAARFAEIDKEYRPGMRRHLCREYPDHTDEERYCRMVLAHARGWSGITPGLSAVLPQLEREFQELALGSGTGEADYLGGATAQ